MPQGQRSSLFSPCNQTLSCSPNLRATLSDVSVGVMWELVLFFCALRRRVEGSGGDSAYFTPGSPVTFPPCQAGPVQSGSSEGWPVRPGTRSPGPGRKREMAEVAQRPDFDLRAPSSSKKKQRNANKGSFHRVAGADKRCG